MRRSKKKSRVHHSPYAWRAVVISQIGYKTYKEYLASELWASIRQRVFERDGGMCRYCGNEATQAHHRNYRTDTISGKRIDDIHSVCGTCHRFIEFVGNKKLSMKQMKSRTLMLVKMATGNT